MERHVLCCFVYASQVSGGTKDHKADENKDYDDDEDDDDDDDAKCLRKSPDAKVCDLSRPSQSKLFQPFSDGYMVTIAIAIAIANDIPIMIAIG